MAKLEYQHGPTLRFLVRCLTMANLDISIMTRLEDALMATRMGEIQRLAQRQCACRRVTVCHLLGVAVHLFACGIIMYAGICLCGVQLAHCINVTAASTQQYKPFINTYK